MFGRLRKLLGDLLEPEIETFQKKEVIFKTTDCKLHKNSSYKWCRISGLISRNFEKYAMIGITSDGYLKDDDGLLFPLNNIISMQWNLSDETERISRYKDQYKIWFSDNELAEMELP